MVRRRRRRGRRPRPKWTLPSSTSTVLAPNRLLAAAVLLLLICPSPAMPSLASLATGEDGTISEVVAAPNGEKNQSSRPERAVTDGPGGGVPPAGTNFAAWINQTQGDLKGPFFNRSQYTEGEVVLFAPRKSHHHRHRATNRITVISSSSSTSIDGDTVSRISDSVTLKEWLKRAFAEEKALKVSVRSTEALRPVLLHLYAARRYFRTPVIIHADTFDCGSESNDAPLSSNGRLGREGEKLVDATNFIHSVHSILPDAVISLGWSDSPSSRSSDGGMQSNCLHWSRAFWLVSQLLGGRVDQQPVLLNMNVRDALRALPQLEWLLGARGINLYLLLHGRLTDLADVESPVSRLRELMAAASSRHGGQRVLFDVDDIWRRRLGRSLESNDSREETGSSQASADWINVAFPSPHAMLSTSVVSAGGMAFLGWPSSLLVSTRGLHLSYPSRQSLRGRVIFLAKRQLAEIHPVGGENGLAIYLFERSSTRSDTWDSEELDLHEPSVKQAVTALIGYDGRVSLENDLAPTSRSDDEHYVKSSSAQLPQWPCYGFELRDRGWRVEMEAWTEPVEECGLATNAGGRHVTSRSYLRLDTPITPSRRSRTVAIGKRGDGAIDFLVQGMEHSGSGGGGSSSASKPISQATTLIVTFCALLSLLLVPKLQ